MTNGNPCGMNAVPIATSTPLPSVGPATAPLMDNLAAAKHALIWLGRHGLRPLQVAVCARVTQIAIETSPLCATLDSACVIRRWNDGEQERVMVALVEGCEVRWVERGH